MTDKKHCGTETLAEQALERLTQNKKDLSMLVKAVSKGIIIACCGIPFAAFGGGYYLAERYLERIKCEQLSINQPTNNNELQYPY